MSKYLSPLSAPYPPKTQALLEPYPRVNGYLLRLFRTFANSDRFLQKGVPNLLDRESPLPLRIREIVINRVTANYNCEYEWGIHAALFQKAAAFSDEEIVDLCRKEISPDLWQEKEANLIHVVDSLCNLAGLTDELRENFGLDWDKPQQLEIINLVSAYHGVSMVANVARLAPEEFALRFPK